MPNQGYEIPLRTSLPLHNVAAVDQYLVSRERNRSTNGVVERTHKGSLKSRAAAPAWGCEARLELDAAGSVNRLKASRVGLSP